MRRRTFEEMISYFNKNVAEMDINRKYKMELLGMITAILQRHDEDVPHWIPVTERLPEERINPNTSDFEPVLCWTVFGDVRTYKYGTVNIIDGAHFWHGVGIMDGYVIAWMPLPEPYKGDE